MSNDRKNDEKYFEMKTKNGSIRLTQEMLEEFNSIESAYEPGPTLDIAAGAASMALMGWILLEIVVCIVRTKAIGIPLDLNSVIFSANVGTIESAIVFFYIILSQELLLDEFPSLVISVVATGGLAFGANYVMNYFQTDNWLFVYAPLFLLYAVPIAIEKFCNKRVEKEIKQKEVEFGVPGFWEAAKKMSNR